MESGIVILGIGQRLRGDDAAGLEAVRLWRESHPETASRPQVRVETLELPGLSLLDYLDGMQAAVIVDAVNSSAPAGRLHHLRLQDLASFMPESRTAHGWGLAETLELGRALNPSLANCRLTLLGIEGKNFEMGAPLSPPVEAALPNVVAVIQKTVRRLLKTLQVP